MLHFISKRAQSITSQMIPQRTVLKHRKSFVYQLKNFNTLQMLNSRPTHSEEVQEETLDSNQRMFRLPQTKLTTITHKRNTSEVKIQQQGANQKTEISHKAQVMNMEVEQPIRVKQQSLNAAQQRMGRVGEGKYMNEQEQNRLQGQRYDQIKSATLPPHLNQKNIKYHNHSHQPSIHSPPEGPSENHKERRMRRAKRQQISSRLQNSQALQEVEKMLYDLHINLFGGEFDQLLQDGEFEQYCMTFRGHREGKQAQRQEFVREQQRQEMMEAIKSEPQVDQAVHEREGERLEGNVQQSTFDFAQYPNFVLSVANFSESYQYNEEAEEDNYFFNEHDFLF